MSITELVALTVSDVEIFLLMNKEQTDYKEQYTFTRDEILEQLKSTMKNVCNAVTNAGVDIKDTSKI